MDCFELFADLPAELRLQIWRYTFPAARNVNIKMAIKENGFGGWVSTNASQTPPIALRICQESRQEALRHYVLSFGTADSSPTIYFNFDIDTLDFRHPPSSSKDEDLQPGPIDYLLNLWVGKTLVADKAKATCPFAIKSMALDVGDDIYGRPNFCWDEVRRFEGLEKLLLVAWDTERHGDSFIPYFRLSLRDTRAMNPEWVMPETQIVLESGKFSCRFEAGEMIRSDLP